MMNNFTRLQRVYCYTLEDFIQNKPYATEILLTNILRAEGLPNTTSTLEEELWDNIYARYYKEYCLFTEEEIEVSEIIDKWFPFWLKFYNILQWTKEKYETLITYYRSNLTKLMDDVNTSSKGVNRFNDTPQSTGLYDDDSHTSSINQTSSEFKDERDTKVQRLKEIQDKMSNVMLDWVNEFDKLFVHESEVY